MADAAKEHTGVSLQNKRGVDVTTGISPCGLATTDIHGSTTCTFAMGSRGIDALISEDLLNVAVSALMLGNSVVDIVECDEDDDEDDDEYDSGAADVAKHVDLDKIWCRDGVGDGGGDEGGT